MEGSGHKGRLWQQRVSVGATSQTEKELCGGGAVLEGQAKGEETKGHCWCVTERCCARVLWGETGEFL